MSRRQLKRLGRRLLSALGLFALPIGILAPLSPDWWSGKWWISLVILSLAVAWAALGLRRRHPRQAYVENFTIRVVVGDLFAQKSSALVGFTTTFDTRVPDVISPTSVQAALLNSVYGGSVRRLDADLEAALQALRPTGETIEKEGKTVKYPMGAVAVLEPPGSVRYYCAAYTEMNSKNIASGTIRGVLDALDESWDQVDARENGGPICVPLIGQGQARIPELTPEIAVRLIAFSFLVRSKRSRFSRELRIVLHPSDQHKVNLPEFQAFLTSLAS